VGVWVIASLALAVAGPNLAWLSLHGRMVGPRWRDRLQGWMPASSPLVWLASSLFLLLPPYLAWRLGTLSLYYLGLTEIDWLALAGAAGMWATSIVALALFGWLVYRRSLRMELWETGGVKEGASAAVGTRAWLAPLDASLWQWHWAFYRAAAIGWLAAASPLPGVLLHGAWAARLAALYGAGGAQPVYWGSWLGLCLAGIEWGLNPFARAGLKVAGRQEATLRAVGLAIATTALFSFTRNFWLCLFCSVTVETLVAGWLPLLSE
jgi:hypothetical protein